MDEPVRLKSEIDLVAVAASHGYETERRASSRGSVVMHPTPRGARSRTVPGHNENQQHCADLHNVRACLGQLEMVRLSSGEIA
jgi:hypothetical protein